jgi:hypothetical protein
LADQAVDLRQPPGGSPGSWARFWTPATCAGRIAVNLAKLAGKIDAALQLEKVEDAVLASAGYDVRVVVQQHQKTAVHFALEFNQWEIIIIIAEWVFKLNRYEVQGIHAEEHHEG